jgi:hypothetical protein
LHPGNFLLVKEGNQFTAIVALENSEIGLDAPDKLGDAALLVAAPRVADE